MKNYSREFKEANKLFFKRLSNIMLELKNNSKLQHALVYTIQKI